MQGIECVLKHAAVASPEGPAPTMITTVSLTSMAQIVKERESESVRKRKL